MKYIQFIDSLNVGGAERMCVNVANVLADAGNEVVLIVSRNSGFLEKKVSQSVKIIFLNKTSFLDYRSLKIYFKFLSQYQPDVVHAHSTSIYWSVLHKIFNKNKYSLVFHDHFGLRTKNIYLKNVLLIFSSIWIDYVIAVSDEIKTWAKNNLFVESKNVFYIRNFPHYDSYISKIRKDFIQIVSLSNFRPEKNHLNLINAVNILINEYKFINIKVVLAGFRYDEFYYNNILDLIKRYNLSTHIELRDNVIEIEQLLAESDIGVLSSNYEGLPLSLLEYGLAGLPVVVTNVGDCAEVIGFGEYGKFVPPADSKALSNALNELLTNFSGAQTMGLRFKKHIQKNYGSVNFIESYNKLLSDI